MAVVVAALMRLVALVAMAAVALAVPLLRAQQAQPTRGAAAGAPATQAGARMVMAVQVL